jgi:hypothetical protein
MSLNDDTSIYYSLLREFSSNLLLKLRAYKIEDKEYTLLLQFNAELNKSIDDPSAWCSVPDAYVHAGTYAFAEFDEYIKAQVMKYAAEDKKEIELSMAKQVLEEWKAFRLVNEEEIYKAGRAASFSPAYKDLKRDDGQESLDDENTPISFYNAANFLSIKLTTRIDRILHELVGWVCGEIYVRTNKNSTTVIRELKAYSSKTLDHIHEFDSIPYLRLSEENEFEYLSYFHGFYFRKSDIESFYPQERYVTGYDLIERWVKFCGSKLGVVAKIVSCGRDERMYWFHPFYLSTTGAPHPKAPLEKHLFLLREVERIERGDFNIALDLEMEVNTNRRECNNIGWNRDDNLIEAKGNENRIDVERADEWREMLIAVVIKYQSIHKLYPTWPNFWGFLSDNPPKEFGVSIHPGKRGAHEAFVKMGNSESLTKTNLKKRFDRLPKIDR